MNYLAPQPNKAILEDNGTMRELFRRWVNNVTGRQLNDGTGSPEGVVEAVHKATYVDESTYELYYKSVDQLDGDKSKGWVLTGSSGSSFWIDHAIAVILSNYGDVVSVTDKNKDLIKFGRNERVGTSLATVAIQPSGILHETYVSTNIIDTISSSSASDTELVSIEGHTIAGGVFTFSKQTATLNGQNKVVLDTPLARCTRIENMGSSDLAGAVYVYEDDTISGGVPTTASKVHMQTRTGKNKSEKCSTTISDNDYWIITGFYGDILEKTSSTAEFDLEIRQAGGVFKTTADVSASSAGGRAFQPFTPYIIAPKNSDIRIVAAADGANTDVSAGIIGLLAQVVA